MHENFAENKEAKTGSEAEFLYGFVGGELVIGISDVVRSACDIKSGDRVWGNAFHRKAKELPGAVIHKGAWTAPAKELARLVASRGDLPKAEETLKALVNAIRMENEKGSAVWMEANRSQLDEIERKKRKEREERMQALLDSVLDWEDSAEHAG